MEKVYKTILLIGMTGTSKTASGRVLAQKINAQFADTDELVVIKEKTQIPIIFETKGEKYFREVESAVIYELSKNFCGVIALGGGAALNEKNISCFDRKLVVLLESSAQTIFDRLRGHVRPLLDGTLDKIKELQNQRKQIYRKLADITVNTDNKTVDQVADDIIKAMFV